MKVTDIQPQISYSQSQSTEFQDLIFHHGIMCQVGMPRKQQSSLSFSRNFKNASLLVEGGKLFNNGVWEQHHVPYGPKARIALAYINTEAIKTKSTEIEIGNSYREFCRLLNLPETGRTYELLKKQINAIAAMQMKYGFVDKSGQQTTIYFKPVHVFKGWASQDPKQKMLWSNTLILCSEYVKDLLEHAVPIPLKVYGSLAHSALAQDQLTWLAKRLPTLKKAIKVPDTAIMEQFGQEYIGKNAFRNFKKEFEDKLRDTLRVYPDANIERGRGYYILKPSKPIVNKTHIVLNKDISFLTKFNQLDRKTLEIFKSQNKDLDPHSCKSDFDKFLETATFPDDYQAAFIAFSKKWILQKA